MKRAWKPKRPRKPAWMNWGEDRPLEALDAGLKRILSRPNTPPDLEAQTNMEAIIKLLAQELKVLPLGATSNMLSTSTAARKADVQDRGSGHRW